MHNYLFYIVIAMISLGGLGMIFSKQIMYSAMFFLAILFTVAAVFIMANAEFLGVAQIIIYIGGILILILFGIIITQEKTVKKRALLSNIPALILVTLFGFIIYKLIIGNKFETLPQQSSALGSSDFTNTENIGIELLSNYFTGLEFIALILLISLIGAVILGGRKRK